MLLTSDQTMLASLTPALLAEAQVSASSLNRDLNLSIGPSLLRQILEHFLEDTNLTSLFALASVASASLGLVGVSHSLLPLSFMAKTSDRHPPRR